MGDNKIELGGRYNDGKPKWSLVDFESLIPMVQVLEFDISNNSEFNITNELRATEICEDMLFYIFDYLKGVDKDQKSELPIEGYILRDCMFLSYTIKNRLYLDDRYCKASKKTDQNTTKILKPDKIELSGRYNDDKPKWSLVNFESLIPLVKVLEFGTIKYAKFDWTKGFPTTEICESMLRHIFAYLNGEDKDEESGLPIEGHIFCNAMFLSYMIKNRPDLDDRYIIHL